MGVRITSHEQSETAVVALYCSTSVFAFGPVFHGWDAKAKARSYLAFIAETDGRDPRTIGDGDLGRLHGEWLTAKCDADGELTEDDLAEDES